MGDKNQESMTLRQGSMSSKIYNSIGGIKPIERELYKKLV